MQRKLAEVALLLGSLVLVLVLLDRGAVWLMSRPRTPYPAARFARYPVKNSLNLVDYEYPREKEAGVFRVLAVGDSFTQGVGVNFDDAWPKRLERYLAAFRNGSGRRYQVLNMGRAGAGTPGNVERIRTAAAEFDPDLIVLGYCLNDSEDTDRASVIVLRQGTSSPKLEKGGRLGEWLFDNWALYRFVRRRIHNTRKNQGLIDYYHAIYREDYPGWVKSREAIADLGIFSRESGIPVVALIFPLFSWNQDAGYPFAGEHARVNALFEKAGLPHLDLRVSYRGLAHAMLEAIPFRDPHPSDVAQRIAAEELFLFLEAQGLLPEVAKSGDHLTLPPPWR